MWYPNQLRVLRSGVLVILRHMQLSLVVIRLVAVAMVIALVPVVRLPVELFPGAVVFFQDAFKVVGSPRGGVTVRGVSFGRRGPDCGRVYWRDFDLLEVPVVLGPRAPCGGERKVIERCQNYIVITPI